MSQSHVTAKGYCAFCGAKLKQCVECQEWFISTVSGHIYCRSRCRTRAYRRKLMYKEIVMPEQETPRKPPVPNQQPDPKPEDDK